MKKALLILLSAVLSVSLLISGSLPAWAAAPEDDAILTAGSVNISEATVSLSGDSFIYTGAEIRPEVTVVCGGVTLVEQKDYVVTYKNNVAAGTATVSVTGKGNYSGSKSVKYTINSADIGDAEVSLSGSEFTYTGAEIRPEVKVTLGGRVLAEGTDYTVSYADNVNEGSAAVTVTGMGSCEGSVSAVFMISGQPFEVTLEGGSVTVSIAGCDGGVIFAAAYDAGGKMLGVRSVPVVSGSGGQTVSFGDLSGAADVKVFIADGESYRPLLAPKTVPVR